MGGAKLLKWRLAAEGAKLLKSGAALILSIPRWLSYCKKYLQIRMTMSGTGRYTARIPDEEQARPRATGQPQRRRAHFSALLVA